MPAAPVTFVNSRELSGWFCVWLEMTGATGRVHTARNSADLSDLRFGTEAIGIENQCKQRQGVDIFQFHGRRPKTPNVAWPKSLKEWCALRDSNSRPSGS